MLSYIHFKSRIGAFRYYLSPDLSSQGEKIM